MGSGIGRRRSAMVPTFGDVTIYLCRDPVDFRLGINGLSTMVEATLKFDPFSRHLFCFVNKRRNQIKVLYWQRPGFCLWLKRLEEEKFKWPVHMTPQKSETVRPRWPPSWHDADDSVEDQDQARRSDAALQR